MPAILFNARDVGAGGSAPQCELVNDSGRGGKLELREDSKRQNRGMSPRWKSVYDESGSAYVLAVATDDYRVSRRTV